MTTHMDTYRPAAERRQGDSSDRTATDSVAEVTCMPTVPISPRLVASLSNNKDGYFAPSSVEDRFLSDEHHHSLRPLTIRHKPVTAELGQDRTHSDDEGNMSTSGSDRHQRSRSIRSHTSHAASHDTHTSSATRSSSSFDAHSSSTPPTSRTHGYAVAAPTERLLSGLGRSGSGASTMPTSPETELSQSLVSTDDATKKENHGSTSAPAVMPSFEDGTGLNDQGVMPAALPVFDLETDELTAVVASPGLTPVAKRSSVDTNKTATPSIHSPGTDRKEEKAAKQPTAVAASSRHPRTSRQVASLAHRNKPLPIPVELHAGTGSSSHIVARHHGNLQVPALNISSSAEMEQERFPGSVDRDLPERGNFYSKLSNKSGKLFRNSTVGKRSTLSPPWPSSSSSAHFSEASLPLHRGSASPSTSQTHLSSDSHASDERSHSSAGHSSDRLGQAALQAATSTPIARSSSPFGFMRRASNRPTATRTQQLSTTSSTLPGHRQRPTSVASSTSSLHSHPSQMTRKTGDSVNKRPSFSSRLSTRFGGLNMASTHGIEAERDDAETVAAAIAEASRKLQRSRPLMHRVRSRSVGDFTKVVNPEALKSLAVGTVSIVDVESANKQNSGSAVEMASDETLGGNEKRQSVSALREDRKHDGEPLTKPEGREGTMSRLAGTLRRRSPPSQIPIKAPANTTEPDSPWLNFSFKHRRHQSAGDLLKPDTARTQAVGESEKPMPPPKDFVDLSPEHVNTWWVTTSDDKNADIRSPASTFSHFEAAQLGAALSAGDQNVEARMAELAESPKQRIAVVRKPIEGARSSSESAEETSFRSMEGEPEHSRSTNEVNVTEAAVGSESTQARNSHRRALSLGKVFEPLVARARSRSNTVTRQHDASEDNSSHYESAISTSTSMLSDVRVPNSISLNDLDPLVTDAPNTSPRLHFRRSSAANPPSSYQSKRASFMSNLGSDPLLTTRIAPLPSKSHIMSSHSSDLATGTRQASLEKAVLGSQPSSVTTSPSPRASSLSVVRTRKISSPTASRPAVAEDRPSGRRQKPALTVDTELTTAHVPRPSSAMGMSANLERGALRHVNRQATLSIADDMEFLQALEQVRKNNQDRIRRQREENDKHERMGRLGIAPNGKRNASCSFVSEQANVRSSSEKLQSHMHSPVKNPSSADGRHSDEASANDSLKSERSCSSTISPSLRPSPLEWGVGKASGKLRDGAFLNDEDWKKEVKALFVIRELVLTERSYARYLEALLHAIRQIGTTPTRRSTTSTLMMTSSSSGRQSGPLPPHIVMMRNLLPQLITLSRTLANRIDENPTAAGVGTAFRLVGVQMEATFVAWSASIKEIMDALRISEAPKAKSRGRIGLIGIDLPKHVGQSADGQQGKSLLGFTSVPSSPTRSKSVAQRAGPAKEARLTDELVESPTDVSIAEPIMASETLNVAVPNPTTSAKRRSTISTLPPSVASNLRAKFGHATASSPNGPVEPSPAQNAAASAVVDESMPQLMADMEGSKGGQNGMPALAKRRMSSVMLSTSNLAHRGRPKNAQSQSTSAMDTSGIMTTTAATSMSSSPDKSSGTTTPAGIASEAVAVKSSFEPVPSKKLTAMDIAIMPTQRIPRYLLLLRDLHANTPPQSLSQVRLQRSLDSVQRMVANCDRASKSMQYKPTHGR